MNESLLIMVAGPYRSGASTDAERAAHLRALNRTALEVFRRGHVPVVGVNAALPVIAAAATCSPGGADPGEDSYESIMMPLCLALAARCDALLRIGGASSGADREAEVVRARGGRIFDSLDEVPDAAHSACEGS